MSSNVGIRSVLKAGNTKPLIVAVATLVPIES
jgi:hypothetical protein